MKRAGYLSLFLAITTALAGLLLAGVNALTADKIKEAAILKEKVNLEKIFPGGTYSEVASTEYTDYPRIVGLYEVEDTGYIYKITTKGYSSDTDIIFMIGINDDGEIVGIEILQHAETPGYGAIIAEDKYKQTVIGKTTNDQIDLVSGATKTSSAMREAIADANKHFNAMKGIENVEHEKDPITLGNKISLADASVDRYKSEIVEKTKTDTGAIYHVKAQGYGLKDAEYPDSKYTENEWKIEVANGEIVKIEMVVFGDTTGFGDKTDHPDYYATLIGTTKDTSEIDTVSGATYTSKSLASAIKIVLADMSAE